MEEPLFGINHFGKGKRTWQITHWLSKWRRFCSYSNDLEGVTHILTTKASLMTTPGRQGNAIPKCPAGETKITGNSINNYHIITHKFFHFPATNL